MRKEFVLLSAFTLLALPLGGGLVTASNEKLNREWTVAMYIDSDNNIDYWGFIYLVEHAIAELVPSPEVTTVIYFDALSPKGVLKIIYDKGLPDISYEKEKNFGDSELLAQFGVETFTKYPAEKYLLLIMNHGRGWGGICVDDTDNGDVIYTPELADALSKISCAIGRPIDVLQFDACAMGNVEVIYEVAPYVNYYIASPEVVSMGTLVYLIDTLLLGLKPQISPEEYAKSVVRTSGQWLTGGYLVAYDTSGIDTLTQSLDELAVALGTEEYREEVLEAYTNTKKYSPVLAIEEHDIPVFVDIYDLASEIESGISDPEVKELCKEVIERVDGLIILKSLSPSSEAVIGNGLSGTLMHYDETIPDWAHKGLLDQYSVLKFAQDTAWDDLLAEVLYL